MHVFVINLDKDKERLSIVSQRLKELGVSYERVAGINANEMTENERRDAVNKFRFWCVVGRQCRAGEIGCAMAHKKVYQQMCEQGISVACILEDDVVLDDRFPEILYYIERNMNMKDCRPQVYLLSNHTKKEYKDLTLRIVSINNDMYAEGYVLNSKGAKLLSRINYPMEAPCDWWGRWSHVYGLELNHVIPAACTQDTTRFASNTGG